MHLHHVLVLLLVWLSFSGRRGIPALQDWQACITRDGCCSGVASLFSQSLPTSLSWPADTSDGRAYHVSPDVRSPSSRAVPHREHHTMAGLWTTPVYNPMGAWSGLHADSRRLFRLRHRRSHSGHGKTHEIPATRQIGQRILNNYCAKLLFWGE
jgi:hypothetical protein